MEELNLEGALARISDLLPLQPAVLDDSHPALVDVRSVSAYQGTHLPGSLSLPEDTISAFAGWLMDPDREIVLVADGAEQAERAARHLFRIGFDRIAGFLPAALPRRAATGRSVDSLPVVHTETVARRVAERSSDWSLLDVRGRPEADEGMVEGARHAFLGRLPEELERLEPSRHYTVMCGSGVRATIAASLLRRAGFEHVDVFLGSMGAWKSAGHPTMKPTS